MSLSYQALNDRVPDSHMNPVQRNFTGFIVLDIDHDSVIYCRMGESLSKQLVARD